MNELLTWFSDGGTVMYALSALALAMSFLIFERFWDLGARTKMLQGAGDAGRLQSPETGELTGLRRMGLIRACIVIAPLLGLLGTVTGMIETFRSILHGGYITEMSMGIRKALLTTQYGLAIAAPGLLAERILLRRHRRLGQLARNARANEEAH